MLFVIFTVLITLAVAFVNGWTDAPNAIASCVSTETLSLKKAVVLAAVADFFGALIIGISSSKVSETVMNIAEFGNDKKLALIGLCAAMCSVVLWAVTAWRFGIPTSESHALVAGISGASVAINGNFSGINLFEWQKVIKGMFVSVVFGFIAGYIIAKLTSIAFRNINRTKRNAVFRYSQIFASMLMAFMHGAQDAQKFAGILCLVMSFSGVKTGFFESATIPLAISALTIAAGTATGGERIIKKIGTDMVKMRVDQGFSSDLSGALCLFISTLLGFPVSTTHTKTSAVIGVGVADDIKSVNLKVAGEMIAAWLFTFPGCGLIGWAVACIFMKII